MIIGRLKLEGGDRGNLPGRLELWVEFVILRGILPLFVVWDWIWIGIDEMECSGC